MQLIKPLADREHEREARAHQKRIQFRLKYRRWQRFFAFTPIRMADGSWVWLEWLERYGSISPQDNKVTWHYREIDKG